MSSLIYLRTLTLGFFFLCFTHTSYCIADEAKLVVRFREVSAAGSFTEFVFETGANVKNVHIFAGDEELATTRVVNQRAIIKINFFSEGLKELRFFGDTYDNGYTKELLGSVKIVKESQPVRNYPIEETERPANTSKRYANNTYSNSEPSLPLSSYNGIGTTATSWNFINQISPTVVRLCRSRGLPASTIVAMASFESSYGTSTAAVNNNNLFGLKEKGYQYSTTSSNTLNRSFNSFEECLVFFIDEVLMHKTASWKKDYSSVIRNYQKNIRAGLSKDEAGLELIRDLVENGYAQLDKDDYAGRIKRIIDAHNLRRLDNASSIAARPPTSNEYYQQPINPKALYPRKR